MISRIASTISQPVGHARAQRVEHAVTALNTTRVRVVCLALIAIFGVTYLWLVNSSASLGFYVSDLESRRVALDDEYQKLEVEETALRSLEHINAQSQQMQMVSSSRVEYMKESAVALSGGN